MSAAGRQVWISVTAGAVATMTMLGIVGWNGAHPHPYYWAIVAILIVSCVLACKKLGPRQNGANGRPRAKLVTFKDGSKQIKGAQHAGQ